MSFISAEKRIIKEEFKSEDRDTIDKLAFILNSFMQQTIDVINGKIDFNNLNQEIIDFNVIVDSDGTPNSNLIIKHNLLTKIKGILCIKAQNLTNSNNYPDSTPFFSYTPGDNNITINNITGLTANNKYILTIILIGTNI